MGYALRLSIVDGKDCIGGTLDRMLLVLLGMTGALTKGALCDIQTDYRGRKLWRPC
jgi:hypothetical protein